MATRGKRGNYQFLNPVSPLKGVYSLIIRQQPSKCKVSTAAEKNGVGEKKTIDPAIIVELKIKDESENPPTHDPVHYLYNPFLFAYATLLDPETEEEIPYSDDSLHILTGSIASCVYHLKDPENSNQFAAFFVFPEIAIRQEGQFRLKISLFKISGNSDDPVNSPSKVVLLQSANTDIFQVYPVKGFPPLLPSSVLSRSFADQGLKLRLRKSARGDSKRDDDDNSSDNDSPVATTPSDLNYKKRNSVPSNPTADAPPRRPDFYPPPPAGAHPYYYRPPYGYPYPPPPPPPPGAGHPSSHYPHPYPPSHHYGYHHYPPPPPPGAPGYEEYARHHYPPPTSGSGATHGYPERPPSSSPSPYPTARPLQPPGEYAPPQNYHPYESNGYHPHYPHPVHHYPGPRSHSAPANNPASAKPSHASASSGGDGANLPPPLSKPSPVSSKLPELPPVSSITSTVSAGEYKKVPDLVAPAPVKESKRPEIHSSLLVATEYAVSASSSEPPTKRFRPEGLQPSKTESPAGESPGVTTPPSLPDRDRPRRLSVPGREGYGYSLPPPGSGYGYYPPPPSYLPSGSGYRPSIRPPPGYPPPHYYAPYPHHPSEYRPPAHSAGKDPRNPYAIPHHASSHPPSHGHHRPGSAPDERSKKEDVDK